MKRTNLITKGMITLLLAATLVTARGSVNPVAKAAAKETKTISGDDVKIVNKPEYAAFEGGGVMMSMEEIDDSRNMKKSVNAKATVAYDEYDSEISNRIGKCLNDQMSAYLSGKSSGSADVYTVDETMDDMSTTKSKNIIKNVSDAYGYVSWVKLYLPKKEVGNISTQNMLYYGNDAISNYPNLCNLSIYEAKFRDKGDYFELFFPSTVNKNEMTKYVKLYNEYLATLEMKPDQSTKMSDTDILLYYNDAVASSTTYANSEVNKKYGKDYTIHMPVGIVKRDDIVCQCYAVVMNHLMRHSGFTCYTIFGQVPEGGHAWNAVKVDNKWYYIDTTWNDGNDDGRGRDKVLHNNFLFKIDNTKRAQGLYSMFNHSDMALKSDNAYASYLPVGNKIDSPMQYVNEKWYIEKNNCVYEWDGINKAPIIKSISGAEFIASVDDTYLYYGGSQGVYRYNTETKDIEAVSDNAYYNGYVRMNKLYAQSLSGSWEVIAEGKKADSKNNIAPSDDKADDKTDDCSDDNDNDDTQITYDEEFTAPHFLVSTPMKKMLRIKLVNTNPESVLAYEVQFSTGKSFASGTKTIKVTHNTVNLKGLKKGKIYYIRVRAVSQRGTYSEWTGVTAKRTKR